MNTIVTIIELVELAALIALVIYLIRLTRDNNELRDKLNKSELVDRNLDEVNEFNGAMVTDPDVARIWQDGCEGYRLNDIDRSRYSLLASQYLSMMANQKQRADSIEDWAQAEAATGRLIESLMSSPGLVAAWDTLAGKIASPELRAAVNQAMSPPELEEDAETEVPAAVTQEPAPVAVDESAAAEESAAAKERTTAIERVSVPEPAAAESQAAVATETEDSTNPKETAESQEQTTVEAGPAADQDSEQGIRYTVAAAAEKDTSSKQTDSSVTVVDDDAEPAIAKAT